MNHKYAIEYEGVNGKREFANTDKLIINGTPFEENEDAVEREAAIAAADFTDCPNVPVEICKQVTDEVVKRLKALPLVTPKQRTGKWREYKAHSFDGEHPSYDITRCSNCNYEALTNIWKYCPNCGSEMENEE